MCGCIHHHYLLLATLSGSLKYQAIFFEFGLQSKLIQEKVQQHVYSSPASAVDALEKLSKDAEQMVHSLV
jgi:hypothetical protein